MSTLSRSISDTNRIIPKDRLSMSVEAASELIGISRATLYIEIRRGQIKTFRVGGRRLISRQAIQDYIQAREEENLASA